MKGEKAVVLGNPSVQPHRTTTRPSLKDPVHKLLERQLKRTFRSGERDESLNALLEAVDATYRQADEDLAIAERALERTSQELIEHNRTLTERSRELERLLVDRESLLQRLKLSDRLAAIGTLAAGVAHEINNPLAFVQANLQLTAEWMETVPAIPGDGEARAEVDEALADAREGVSRIAGIVRDLKTLSRGDDERLGPVDVHAVIEGAITMVKHEVHHRATLVRSYGEIPKVHANEARLGQVFLNLLVNAAQAIDEGAAATNEIRIGTETAPSGEVVIEVRDTGHGIAEELRARIFDPFFTTKPVGVGTGLGLSICRGIIDSFGGSIQCESEVGGGSVFRVLLPGTVIEAEAPTSPEARASTRRGRVLIVDDELAVVNALKRSLVDQHEVVVETSGRAALDLLAKDPAFDVILCDLMMPDTTGMDVFDELADSRPSICDRIVFVTGGTFTARALSFRERVRNRFVDKPFDVGALRTMVSELID